MIRFITRMLGLASPEVGMIGMKDRSCSHECYGGVRGVGDMSCECGITDPVYPGLYHHAIDL